MTIIRALAYAASVFCLAGLAVGCIDVQVSSDDADADGDGYDNVAEGGTDCNDSDPEVHPDVDEICDDEDNDCDGYVGCDDENVDDLDQDEVCTCEDCDDLDPDNTPGKSEICDGQDNDCDGLVDCEDPDLPDTDGDGVCFCDDCDDANPYNAPGNLESCDGMDNDCDGDVDEDFWAMNVGMLTCAIDPANPVCSDPAVSIASQVIDLDMSSLTGVTIALYTTDPVNYTWEVGDSPSNDCCCGDSSDRSHDGEVYVTGGNDVGVCSQDGYAWTDNWP